MNNMMNYNNLPADIKFLIFQQNRISALNKRYKKNYNNVINEINFINNRITRHYMNKHTYGMIEEDFHVWMNCTINTYMTEYNTSHDSDKDAILENDITNAFDKDNFNPDNNNEIYCTENENFYDNKIYNVVNYFMRNYLLNMKREALQETQRILWGIIPA